MVLGFICIVVELKGYLCDCPHGILGLIVVALSIIVPILGFTRPLKDHPRRRMWEYAHKGLGRITVFAGLINSSLGAYLVFELSQDSALLPLPIVYAVIAVVIVA